MLKNKIWILKLQRNNIELLRLRDRDFGGALHQLSAEAVHPQSLARGTHYDIYASSAASTHAASSSPTPIRASGEINPWASSTPLAFMIASFNSSAQICSNSTMRAELSGGKSSANSFMSDDESPKSLSATAKAPSNAPAMAPASPAAPKPIKPPMTAPKCIASSLVRSVVSIVVILPPSSLATKRRSITRMLPFSLTARNFSTISLVTLLLSNPMTVNCNGPIVFISYSPFVLYMAPLSALCHILFVYI